MSNKAVVSLTTGLEDPERVMVAFLTAVAAAEAGRPTLMFLTKEAVRLGFDGIARGVPCEGCPSIEGLVERYQRAGGRFLVCPICVNAKGLGDQKLVEHAEVGGTVPMWEWIGDEAASTFSF